MKTLIPAFFLILLGACQSAQKEESAENKSSGPLNIIFIMTDDHAYQAISAYGSSLIETPHIDRLANEGIRFDQAFVSNSICSPSRAVTITGKHSHLNGVKDNLDVFDSTQVTLPKILKSSGYQTAMVGKWHLKSEPTGFDYWRVLPDQGDYYQPDFRVPGGDTITLPGYVTDIVTDLAIGYLDSIRDQEKPFLLMYQHKAPHREWWPAMEDLTAFHGTPIPEPSTLYDDYSGRGTAAVEAEMRISVHMGLTNDNKVPPPVAAELGFTSFMDWYDGAYARKYDRLTAEQRAAWDQVYGPIVEDFRENTPSGAALTAWKYQRYMQDYLATIKRVDDNIGRLLNYLDEQGLAENTLVVYTSDQGFYLGEHGWFDKRFMYEESFRTPLIMRWPGVVEAGRADSSLVQNIDYAPTLLEAAGLVVPEDMQGVSLIPLLKGEPDTPHDALYYHYYEYPGIHAVKRHYGIRTNRYKLIHFYYDIDEWELYDLKTDPMEMRNLYDDPSYAEVREQLHEQLKELQIIYQDSDALREQMLESDLDRLAAK